MRVFTSRVRQHFNVKNKRLVFSSVAYSHFSFSIFVYLHTIVRSYAPHTLTSTHFTWSCFFYQHHFKWCVQNIWISNLWIGEKARRQEESLSHCFACHASYTHSIRSYFVNSFPMIALNGLLLYSTYDFNIIILFGFVFFYYFDSVIVLCMWTPNNKYIEVNL